jgi:hypothetical protein
VADVMAVNKEVEEQLGQALRQLKALNQTVSHVAELESSLRPNSMRDTILRSTEQCQRAMETCERTLSRASKTQERVMEAAASLGFI